MALSKVDLANQVENDLPQSLIANNVNFRNIIINGDMSIAQRGTSDNTLSSSGYYTLDRFKFQAASAGVWTMSQDTDVPTGQGFAKSLKMDCTSTDAVSGNDLLIIRQYIEGQNLQYLKKGTANAQSLTASFWVKSNKTGTYILELFDTDNTRQISKSYTIDSADTWEKKTISIPADTTGAFGNDNGGSLIVSFWLAAGSDYTSGTLSDTWTASTTANRAVGQVNLADSTDNEWYITGVQLEAGTSASDFEFLPVDVNLTRCQRYCFSKIGSEGSSGAAMLGASGNARNSTQAFPQYIFPTKMRTLPSLTVNNATGFLLFQTSVIQCTAVSLDVADPYACSIVATVASGLSSPTFYSFGCNSGTSQLIFNAEL